MCGVDSEGGAEKCGLNLCCSYYGVSILLDYLYLYSSYIPLLTESSGVG